MRIRPRNAYEACMQAADMIEHNPLNYLQEAYCTTRDEIRDQTFTLGKDVPIETLTAALCDDHNLCGSAYCRAGWIILLCLGEEENGLLIIRDHYGRRWNYTSSVLAGVMDVEDVYGSPDFSQEWDRLVEGKSNPFPYGTNEYHIEGARGLRAFAQKWRDRLEKKVYTFYSNGRVAAVNATPVIW